MTDLGHSLFSFVIQGQALEAQWRVIGQDSLLNKPLVGFDD